MPEQFEIIFSNQAAKYYQKLPKYQARRVDQAFLVLEKDPIGLSDVKVMSGKPKRLRLRVGDLRIIYQISFAKRKILISVILPRGQVYKKEK